MRIFTRIAGLTLLLTFSAPVFGAPQKPATQPEEPPLLKKLTPVESGRGILVGEPVAEDVAGPMANFGAACSRWLYFVVGGHGELGKTPVWDDINAAIEENNRVDLQIGAVDVPVFGKALGVTDIVTAVITGTPEQGEIDFQLWDVAKNRKTGAALIARGSEEEILKLLPSVARDLAKRLGITEPRISEVGISAEDMTFLGSLAWGQYGNELAHRRISNLLPGGLQPQHIRLARQKPFAEVSLKNFMAKYRRAPKQQVEARNNKTTENVLYLAAVGIDDEDEYQYLRTPAARSLASYPHNYALVRAVNNYFRGTGNDFEARENAEFAVRYAPANPYAWVNLSSTIMFQSQVIRQSRVAADITEQEWDKLNFLYSEALQASFPGPKLAPNSARAWHRLSVAAIFAGVEEIGVNAILKAQEANPYNTDIYLWAFQIFQPKWTGDVDSLKKLMGKIPDEPTLFLQIYKGLTEVLQANDMDDEVSKVGKMFAPALRRAFSEATNDREALSYLSQLKNYVTRDELRNLYEKFIESHSDNIHALIQAAHAFLPDKSGEIYLIKAMKLDPNSPMPFTMYMDFHQQDQPAVREQAVLKLLEYAPNAFFTFFNIAQFYESTVAYDKALDYGRKALDSKPTDIVQLMITYRLMYRCLQAQNREDDMKALKEEAEKLGVKRIESTRATSGLKNDRPAPNPGF